MGPFSRETDTLPKLPRRGRRLLRLHRASPSGPRRHSGLRSAAWSGLSFCRPHVLARQCPRAARRGLTTPPPTATPRLSVSAPPHPEIPRFKLPRPLTPPTFRGRLLPLRSSLLCVGPKLKAEPGSPLPPRVPGGSRGKHGPGALSTRPHCRGATAMSHHVIHPPEPREASSG